ncbi:MAG: ABC transporter substrate-binding protein [Pseudonocardia sp.]
MNPLAVTAEQHVAAAPETVFALFGAGAGAGWVFDATCDQVSVGAVVTLRVPFGNPVELLGRISRLDPPHRIELVHDLPWRGRVRLLLDADGAGTRVRLVADVDAAGLEWLMRRHGHPVEDPGPSGAHVLGLLTSKSGSGSVFAAATEYAATLAVEEVNADGGVHGRPLRLVVGDDATQPWIGAAEARRLVRAGARAVLVTTTSATFARTAAVLRHSGVLLVQTLMNEGGLGDELRFQLGERPLAQLRAACGPVMRSAAGRRWFLAGNAYVWPRMVHGEARRVLGEQAATIVGERFAPLGTGEFGPLIERIERSGADVVLSSFVGADLVAFERQCHAMGLRRKVRTLALTLDEPTRERIGDAAAEGMWGVSGYFTDLPGARNQAFLRRYRARYGRFAPPLSSIGESAYEGVHLYVAAARRASSTDPAEVARELLSARVPLPRGVVALDGPEGAPQQLHLAEARPGGFALYPTG